MESSATRPLRLRIRPDLEIRAPGPSRDQVWMLRDPVTLRYFRLIREEYELVKLLDGAHSLADLQRQFQALFSPVRLELERLTAFLSRLYSEGLLVADAPDQALPLLNRRRKSRTRAALARWTNPLAIRGPGVSPGAGLEAIARRCGWLFTLPGAVLATVLLAAALMLVVLQWPTFMARVPQIESFFAGTNFLLMLAVLAGVKVVHELGHAVACRKFGGQCHQIGVMLLLCVPTLFCDVSDAWRIPEKRKRIIISAAGMYVETLLASIATLIWWNTAPGLLNAVCLNVMLICSVSTLLVNGNPFLRYDGYYILADIVNMPNLRQRSTDWWQRRLKSLCLGIEPLPEDLPTLRRHSLLFAVYGALATAFRFFVLGGMLWLAYKFLHARELTVFFFPLLLLVGGGTVGPPARRAFELARDPLKRTQMKPARIAGTLLIIVLAALFVGFVPLPAYVYCPVLIEPSGAQHVYAPQSGRLSDGAAENQPIAAGDRLFRLENDSLALELQQLTGRLAHQQIRLRNLEAQSARSREVQNEIPLAQELLRDLQEQERQLRERRAQLEGFAERDGVVFPPPVVHAPRGSDWDPEFYSGTPLDPANRGCWVEAGTLLCSVGDPNQMLATLLADERQLKLIRHNQTVEILPQSTELGVIRGRVETIGRTRQEMAPEAFLPDDRIVIVPRADGTRALVNPLWEIRVTWPDPVPGLEPGLRGTARIRVDSMTLLTRFLRWVNRTFEV